MISFSWLCGRERILLVDDEALVALAAEDILISEGYIVVGPADRLESALRLAQNEALDGTVLDINLAGNYVSPSPTPLFASRSLCAADRFWQGATCRPRAGARRC